MVQVEVVLREYRGEDLDALYALDVMCFEPRFRFSRAAMRRFAQAPKARVVIATIAGRVAAFGILHIEKTRPIRSGYLVTLDVDPGYRRLGLGKRLMAALEQKARSSGCGALLLHVSSRNEAAICFYEGSEFSRSHLVRGFYGAQEDAWAYRKILRGS